MSTSEQDEKDETAGMHKDQDEKLCKLYEDMYLGRGKNDPPVTLRLDRLENSVAEMIRDAEKIKWILIATIASIIGDIISNHIHFKF